MQGGKGIRGGRGGMAEEEEVRRRRYDGGGTTEELATTAQLTWMPNSDHVTKAVTGTTKKPMSATSESGSVRHHSVRKRDVCRA